MNLQSYIHSGIGNKIGNILHLSAREAIPAINLGAVLLDVREEYSTSYKSFDVPKILSFPASMYEKSINNLPPNQFYIVADSVGLHSKEICHKLLDAGFSAIANLAGGIVEWERDGFPLKTNINEQLNGSCLCQLKPRSNK